MATGAVTARPDYNDRGQQAKATSEWGVGRHHTGPAPPMDQFGFCSVCDVTGE